MELRIVDDSVDGALQGSRGTGEPILYQRDVARGGADEKFDQNQAKDIDENQDAQKDGEGDRNDDRNLDNPNLGSATIGKSHEEILQDELALLARNGRNAAKAGSSSSAFDDRKPKTMAMINKERKTVQHNQP